MSEHRPDPFILPTFFSNILPTFFSEFSLIIFLLSTFLFTSSYGFCKKNLQTGKQQSPATLAQQTTKGSKLLSLAQCFDLLYEHSIEIKTSKLELEIQKREFEKVLNQFNLGLNTDYTISNSEFGGSSVNSQLFGTEQTRDMLNIGLDQPLETGGTLGLEYSNSKNETNSTFGDPITFGSSVGLTWFQPIFQNGTHSVTMYEQYSKQLALAQAMLTAEEELITIRFKMVTNFLNCMSKQEDVKILKLSAKTNEEILNVSKARRKAGLTTKLDVLESELQHKSALSNLRKGIGDKERALNNLARSLGTKIGEGTKIEYEIKHLPGSPDFDKTKATAMNDRNDIEIQRYSIQSAELDKDFRHNQKEPNIEFVSSISYSGEGSTKGEGSKLDNKSYSVGVAYTTRFGRRDETIDFRIFQERVKLAQLGYKELEQDIELEIGNNIQTLKDTEDLVKLTNDEQILAREQFKFMQIAYENQLRILRDVLEAERQLTETRSRNITSRISHLTAWINLLKSKGNTLSFKEIQNAQKEILEQTIKK